MDYQRLPDGNFEIIPGENPVVDVLEEIARQSFRTSLVRTPFQRGSQFPSEQAIANHDFSQYLTQEPIYNTQTVDEPRTGLLSFLGPKQVKKRVHVGDELVGMRIDYPDGRQCKTWVVKRDDKYVLLSGEYAASETLGADGNVVTRNPEELLESVKSTLDS